MSRVHRSDRTSQQGGLPKGWAATDIQSVADVNPGLAKAALSDDLEVSFVPMPAVEAGTGLMDVSTTRRLADVKKGYTPFLEGDVLFAKITPCMENGKMAIVPRLKNAVGFGSTEFHVLRPYPGINARYLYHYVSARAFRRDAEHNMTGAVGQRRVPTTYISAHPLPLPPSREQERIVARLDELGSELDNGIANLKTAAAQLQVCRQALLVAAFLGRLTVDWRRQRGAPDTAKAIRTRLERERRTEHNTRIEAWQAAVAQWENAGARGQRPRKPRDPRPIASLLDTAGLPALPEGWLWEKLGWMTCGVEYGTAAKSAKAGKVAVIRMGNIQNASLDWSDLAYTSDDDEIAAYLLSPGDVLFNRTNSPELVGKTALYKGEQPAIFAGYLIRVNHIPRLVDGQYLNLFLNSHLARMHGSRVKTDGVNQSNINGEKLSHYPFPFCSLEEQREIVRLLDEKLSLIEQAETQIDHELTRADALRQAILAKAFSGSLVSQDLSDEPAPSLLARLRAERTAMRTIKTAKNKRSAA